ncbi:MAG: DUF5686 family protein [Bacteroidota bacterium]
MLRFRWTPVFGLVLLLGTPVVAQNLSVTIRGIVRDSVTGERLGAATVRLLGTSRGTIANTEGMFALDVPPGKSVLVVSSLAYSPDTLAVTGDTAGPLDVLLSPSAIVLPEVVVSSEDPAVEIIRRAIARKHQWIDRLMSYSMEAFTRQILFRDSSIASITESMTRGYWRSGDTLREVIVQRRQTRNVKESFNFAAVGVILNFNEDHVHFVGYDFIGPTADDALEYYDYRLLRTRVSHGREVFDIAMRPRVRTHPLFRGTVSIAGDTYALVGVDVEPNEAFGLPFVREFSIRYQQQFGLFDSTFWMPVDIRIQAHVIVGIPGISLPAIGFEQTSSISSYAINVPLPDSIFHKSRISVDSLATRPDSTAWESHATIPMTPEEQQAYQTLDSSKTLEMQFRPGGLVATLSAGEGAGWSILSHLDLAFNRVEGGHAGLNGKLDSLSPYIEPEGRFAYGFAVKKSSWEIGTTIFTDREHQFGIGGSIYRRYDCTPGWQKYDPLFNAIVALFAKEDVYDYYRAEGWSANSSFTPSPFLNLRVTYTNEDETPAPKVTNYSFLYHDRPFRDNPPADPGRMRSMRLDFRLGREALPIDLITYDGLGVSIEHSSPSLLGSDYNFTQYNAYGTFSIVTFGRSFLFKPQLRVRASAGTTTGTVPRQRYFSVETGAAGTSSFGAMHSMGLKEFRGTSYAALEVEHNFRSLPFLLLGIPSSLRFNLEFLLHAGMANSWGQGDFPHHSDGWYYEAGFGLSRILDLFRMDFTWRLSAPGGFAVSIGVANLF